MKFKLFIFIIFSIYCATSYAQEKESNIIVLVDGNIVKYTYGKIIYEESSGVKDTINVTIVPGRVKMNSSDYDKLLLKNIETIYLKFSYSETCNGNTEYYDYEIEDFKLNWLDHDYIVLNVYNTNKKAYKRIYNPLPGKEYTYEYEYPGSGMRRAKKILPKYK